MILNKDFTINILLSIINNFSIQFYLLYIYYNQNFSKPKSNKNCYKV